MTAPRLIAGEAAMAEIAAVVGMQGALALAKDFGGTTIYVPRTIGEHHPIGVALGLDASALLSQWAGGTNLLIPKGPEQRARVLALRRQGALTVAQIARQTGYTERHIYRILQAEDAARQPDFFDR